MATKKQTQVKGKSNGNKTITLAIGIFLIICAFVFVGILLLKQKQPEKVKKPDTEENQMQGDYEDIYEVKKITISSKSTEYHTNLVDILVQPDQNSKEEIEYIYISNIGYGQEETRYFADEKIIDWPISETQDGQEHTIYITIVDKNGDIGRETATYKVDLR